MRDGSPLAILQGKCPRCRKGEIFSFPLKDIRHFSEMNKQCPHCGVWFEPEPGFYQGAMFVSYALIVMLFVVISLALYVCGVRSEIVFAVTSLCSVVLLSPINFRYSRVLFLHLFGGIKFNPDWDKS